MQLGAFRSVLAAFLSQLGGQFAPGASATTTLNVHVTTVESLQPIRTVEGV